MLHVHVCHILFSSKPYVQYIVSPNNQIMVALSVILGRFRYGGMDSFSDQDCSWIACPLNNMDTICEGKSYYSERTGSEHNCYAVAIFEDGILCTVGRNGICWPTPVLPSHARPCFGHLGSETSFSSLEKYRYVLVLPRSLHVCVFITGVGQSPIMVRKN